MCWEQEKAYAQRRASGLKIEMEAAIAASDKEGFTKAYKTAMRYMTKKELKPLYIGFLKVSQRKDEVV